MGNHITWVKSLFVESKLRVTLPVFALYPQRKQKIPLGHKVPCLLFCSPPTVGAGDPFRVAEGDNTLTYADTPVFKACMSGILDSSLDGFKHGMLAKPSWLWVTLLYILMGNDLFIL